MYIETVDDILEELADVFMVYGGHSDENAVKNKYCCRSHWVSNIKDRLRQAIKNEAILEALKDGGGE